MNLEKEFEIRNLVSEANKKVDLANQKIESFNKIVEEKREKDKVNDDKIMTAWGIIANVSDGDWTKQKLDWQNAAIKWRDEVFSKEKEKKTLSSKIKPEMIGAQVRADKPILFVEDVKEAIKEFIDWFGEENKISISGERFRIKTKAIFGERLI